VHNRVILGNMFKWDLIRDIRRDEGGEEELSRGGKQR